MNKQNLKQWARELKSEITERERIQRKQQRKVANELGTQIISFSQFVNSHNIMRLPIFSTKYVRNGRRTEPICYSSQDGTVAFTVKGASGIPDQADANVLRYAISKARRVRRKIGVMPERVDVTRYELLRALGKSDSGNSYKKLEKTLECLAGMQLTGNVFRKDEMFTGTLVAFSYTYKANGQIDKIRIAFNEDFREHLEKEKAVLAIPSEILRETNALRIRIMELVQAGMGYDARWAVKLKYLRELCAYTRQMKFLKQDLKKLKLPYHLTFTKAANGDQVIIFTRQAAP